MLSRGWGCSDAGAGGAAGLLGLYGGTVITSIVVFVEQKRRLAVFIHPHPYTPTLRQVVSPTGTSSDVRRCYFTGHQPHRHVPRPTASSPSVMASARSGMTV